LKKKRVRKHLVKRCREKNTKTDLLEEKTNCETYAGQNKMAEKTNQPRNCKGLVPGWVGAGYGNGVGDKSPLQEKK